MYGGHIRHGLPILGGAGAVFGGHDRGGDAHAFGGLHSVPGGPHGALPFTGFDSLKLAVIALLPVVGGLLLMRMVMLISNDN